MSSFDGVFNGSENIAKEVNEYSLLTENTGEDAPSRDCSG